MKAMVYKEYGGPEVLHVEEIDKPSPKDNEILVKVYASSVTAGMIAIRKGEHPGSKLFTLIIRLMNGLKKPKKEVLGYEVAGVVEEVGTKVSSFKVGDEVFGTTTGLAYGAYAEYVCIPEKWKKGVIARKPDNMSFKESVAIPIGGMAALFLMKRAHIKNGQKVLIYGATGSVGTYAVQLAKHFGGVVTGVCSGKNKVLVESIGANKVIDYTREDFTKDGETYDVIFDAVGKISLAKCKGSLKNKGTYLTINRPTSETTENLLYLKHLAEMGEIRPVIDKSYGFEELVKANHYVDTGRKVGNVVINHELLENNREV